MKSTIALVCVFATLCAISFADDEKYTDKYDNLDVDNILNNERLLTNYANCIMDKGKCTPEGEELKSRIPEALETNCAKCSENHKKGIKKVVAYIAKNKPDLWKAALEKYDADGKYRAKYADILKELGVDA